jgi:hypothetical protein
MKGFVAVSSTVFAVKRDRSRRGSFLTKYSVSDLKRFKTFKHEEFDVGYAISPDGELVNLFNNSDVPGLGKLAVEDAKSRGARKLDAYDGYLTQYYKSLGFKETQRVKFLDEYAPDGWDFQKNGRPDIVYMVNEQ